MGFGGGFCAIDQRGLECSRARGGDAVLGGLDDDRPILVGGPRCPFPCVDQVVRVLGVAGAAAASVRALARARSPRMTGGLPYQFSEVSPVLFLAEFEGHLDAAVC